MLRIPPGPLTLDMANRLSDLLNGLLQRVPISASTVPLQNASGGFFVNNSFDNAALNLPFWVRITAGPKGGGGPDANFFEWQEMIADSNGAWSDYEGGRSGTYDRDPAFGANSDLPYVGMRVMIRRWTYTSDYEWMYVFVSDMGGITVRETDGTPSYPGTTILAFNQADGFVVSAILGGSVIEVSQPARLTVTEVDGAPSYSNITTLRFDQDDGFAITQPATGIARIDQTPASATTVGYVSTGAQSLAGLKTFTATTTIFSNSVVTLGLLETAPYNLYGISSTAVASPFVNTRVGEMTVAGHGYFGVGLYLEQNVGMSNAKVSFLVAHGGGGSPGPGLGVLYQQGGDTKFCVSSSGTIKSGASGTDSIGNVFYGGIVETIGGSSVGPTSGGTGLTTYTTGDILYASAANTLASLAIGSDGDVLIVSSGLPAWGTVGVAGGGTGYSSYTVGDILWADTTSSLSKLGIGTADFVLFSDGSAPQWGLSPFTATTATDWAASTPPTNLKDAADRFAAALTILGQPP